MTATHNHPPSRLAERVLAACPRPGVAIGRSVLMTGFFGVPGRTGGRVHLVLFNGKPACGTPLRADSRFQWCSNRPVRNYLECERCSRLLTDHEHAVGHPVGHHTC